MSKRKAPEASSDKAAGKRPAAEAEADEDDLLEAALLLGGDDGSDLDADADDLAAAVDGIDGDGGFGDDDGFDGGFGGGGSESEADGGDAYEGDDVADAIPLDEAVVSAAEEVSLKGTNLTLPEARRVAQLLAANTSLATIHFESHDMSVTDLADDDELEWDSEEYTDLEAIVIAELLKANTSVKRLDLARNQIGDAGARALAAMLGVNGTLEYLNLESNVFGEKAGEAFATGLGSNATLQYLNLTYNSVPSGTQDEIRAIWQAGEGRGKTGLHL